MDKDIFERKTISDFTSPGYILSLYYNTPEYILCDYLRSTMIIPVNNIKSMINRIIFTEKEMISGLHDKAKELIALSNNCSHLDDEDYKKEIVAWYKSWEYENTDDNNKQRKILQNEKKKEANNIEMKNFENSLVPGGKVVFCDIGGFPEKVVSVVNFSGNIVLLEENYYLVKDKYNRWTVCRDNELVAVEPRLYIDGVEDFILVRNGTYNINQKKNNRYKAKTISYENACNYISYSLDDIFDINNYVQTYMKGISAGSIMAYMNRVFGPSNFSGDFYKDMCGRWLISTPNKNLILSVRPNNTSDNYAQLWFRFYVSREEYKHIRTLNMSALASYTKIMKETLDYLLRPTNERDVYFNIAGEYIGNSPKKTLEPHWASTMSLSFITENKENFHRFCKILNQQKGKDEQDKFYKILKKLEE